MDTKYGEKTFLWSAFPNKSGGDIRTARQLIDTQEMYNELEKTRKLLRTDTLTRAYTRHALDEDFQEIIMQNQREQDAESITMFFLDIDNFKRINDIYGHNTGDTVLENLVKHIKNHIREGDEIYRYG
jgi:diguanylate cyclase (GGDEF)-like protein